MIDLKYEVYSVKVQLPMDMVQGGNNITYEYHFRTEAARDKFLRDNPNITSHPTTRTLHWQIFETADEAEEHVTSHVKLFMADQLKAIMDYIQIGKRK